MYLCTYRRNGILKFKSKKSANTYFKCYKENNIIMLLKLEAYVLLNQLYSFTIRKPCCIFLAQF